MTLNILLHCNQYLIRLKYWRGKALYLTSVTLKTRDLIGGFKLIALVSLHSLVSLRVYAVHIKADGCLYFAVVSCRAAEKQWFGFRLSRFENTTANTTKLKINTKTRYGHAANCYLVLTELFLKWTKPGVTEIKAWLIRCSPQRDTGNNARHFKIRCVLLDQSGFLNAAHICVQGKVWL